jgi:hypothetical protein
MSNIKKELLKKIKSVKLCLMAHPDNQEHSEFADRIADLKEIENELQMIISLLKIKKLN